MRIFYSGDFHFDHRNIIKYAQRIQYMSREEKIDYEEMMKHGYEYMCKNLELSYESLHRMNEGIIKICNDRMKPEDTLIHNGDWCFKGGMEGGTRKARDWESRLNCKVIQIRGSHDKNNTVKSPIISMTVMTAARKIFIAHDPRDAEPGYRVNLTAHVHRAWKFKRLGEKSDMINVGIDVWGYPVEINHILTGYNQWRGGKRGNH